MGDANLPVPMPEEANEVSVPFWQLAPAIEFVCWVEIALAPMLYLVNGPPVTSDQAVVQISLATLALVGAISMRVVNLRNSKCWAEILAVAEEK